MVVVVPRIAGSQDGVEAVRARGAGDGRSADRHGETERRRPDIRCQVLVSVIRAGIDHCDDVGRRTSGDVPRRDGPDVGANLKHILERPELREARIGELLRTAQRKSKNFSSPPLIVIGGYALRVHVPFARYSRDCDFAIPKRQGGWPCTKEIG